MNENILNLKLIIKFRILIILILISTISISLISGTNGQTGNAFIGCGSHACHNGDPNDLTEILISSKTGFTIMPNKSIDITIKIKNAAYNFAGIDAGVKTTSTSKTNIGTISNPGTGVQILNNEITHTSPMQFIGDGYEFTFTWTAPQEEGQYYIQVGALANNNNGNPFDDIWNTSVQKITVTNGAILYNSSFNNNESICQGSNQLISWNSSGFLSLKIELSADSGKSYNTTLFSGCQASKGYWNWNVSKSLPAGKKYKIKLSDSDNPSTFDESNKVFEIKKANEIVNQPKSQNKCIGSNCEFEIVADGVYLRYVWYKNKIEISNSNSPKYILSYVDKIDSGNYSCKIFGECGEPIESNIANLKIISIPIILNQPQSKTLCIGDTLKIYANVSGNDLIFEWYKDNVKINNNNSSTFIQSNFQINNSGEFKLIARSPACNFQIESDIAYISRGFAAKINSQPINVNTCLSNSATLSLIASGTNLNYKWYKNNNIILNAKDYYYTINKVDSNDIANYFCTVTAYCGTPIYSNTVNLSLNNLPKVSISPSSQIGIEGEYFVLSAILNSKSQNLKYKWYKDNNEIPNSNLSNLEFNKLKLSDLGNYYCNISNDCGSISSNTYNLKIKSLSKGILFSKINTLNFYQKLFSNQLENTFEVENKGNEQLKLIKAEISGINSNNFITKGLILPQSILPHQSLIFTIDFDPKVRGIYFANLILASEDSQIIESKLIGKTYIKSANISLNKPFINFYSDLNKSSSNTITIFNNSNNIETFSSNFYISDSNFKMIYPNLPFSIKENGFQNVVFNYSPKIIGISNAICKIPVDLVEDSLNVVLIGSCNFDDVSIDNLKSSIIFVKPNPISNFAEIIISPNNNNDFQFKIINSRGELIKVFNNINSNSILWDTKDFQGNLVCSGIYYGIYQSGIISKIVLLSIIR